VPSIRRDPELLPSIIRSLKGVLIAIINRKPLRPTCEVCGGNMLDLGDMMMCNYCGHLSGELLEGKG
jgi:hypothetical protein